MRKFIILLFALLLIFVSCGGDENSNDSEDSDTEVADEECPDGITTYTCETAEVCEGTGAPARCVGDVLHSCQESTDSCSEGLQTVTEDCYALGGICDSPYTNGCGGSCIFSDIRK